MVLTREDIIRMAGNADSVGSGSGTGGGTDLSGYATNDWVTAGYVAIELFNELFTIHISTRVVVTNAGSTISDTTTDGVLTLPAMPGTTTETDAQTGNVTTTTVTITSLEVKTGLWTNSFLSALGQNNI